MSMNRKKRGATNLTSNAINGVQGTASEWEWMGPCKIHLLPLDTVIDILSRLPIKAILNCRCVCKAWLHLISHPRFAQLHLSRSSLGLAILIKTVPCVKDSRKITMTQVDQRGREPFRLHKLTLTPKMNLPSSKFGLVNSCNGLLCLSGVQKKDPIWVCNPILGEYVTVPSACKGRRCGSFLAIGFCSVTNRFKVVQTFYPKVQVSGNDYQRLDAEIYYLDTGTWRSIGYAPYAPVDTSFNSFLRGALHWVSITGNSSECISSFNFESEEFGSVPPPPRLEDPTIREFYDFIKLGVVEGCLFLCVFGDDSWKFDIWVMRDHGLKESWTKQFVIQDLYPKGYGTDFYEPVLFLNNGEILMLYNNSQVVCYNTETKRLRGTTVTRTRNGFFSIGHAPSFVSLYHVAKGKLVQRVQGRKEYANLFSDNTNDWAGSGVSINEPA